MRVEVEGTGYVKWKRWEWYKRAVVKVKERLYLISIKYQRKFYIYWYVLDGIEHMQFSEGMHFCSF